MLKKGLNAISLAGIGIGGIIGAGFFLGSGLAVHEAGPSVILAFILGGLIMTQVLGAIMSIHVNRLDPGSFRVYAEQILGPYIGFLIGWGIFSAGISTMVAEALAMGIFVKYWYSALPLPVLAIIFILVVIGLNSLGVGALGKIETIMAVLKVLILLIFIGFGGYILLSGGILVKPNPLSGFSAFFPNGLAGLFQSMLIVIFSFAGISAMALAATETADPRHQIPEACAYLSVGTILIYSSSMLVLVLLVPWTQIYTAKSPFVQAFDLLHAKWASDGVNIIILVAAFSVIAATYYTATRILVSLGETGKAPALFTKVTKGGLPYYAWLMVGICALLVAAASFVVPRALFHYLISASSYFTFLNWTVNLATYLAWLKLRRREETFSSGLILGRWGAIVTIAAIVALTAVSLRVAEFRMGFYAAAGLICLISLGYRFYSVKEK